MKIILGIWLNHTPNSNLSGADQWDSFSRYSFHNNIWSKTNEQTTRQWGKERRVSQITKHKERPIWISYSYLSQSLLHSFGNQWRNLAWDLVDSYVNRRFFNMSHPDKLTSAFLFGFSAYPLWYCNWCALFFLFVFWFRPRCQVPKNCLVGDKGTIKISGFHCARWVTICKGRVRHE